jgi:hydrophobe/amphiphile efflux-3 (HAE3) family protein
MRGRLNVDVGALISRVTSFSVRRARLVVGTVVVLSLLAALLALRLDPSASPSTFVDRDGPTARATDDLHRKFGDEPIVVLVRGRLTGMLLTQDVGRMLALEGCLAGNRPRGAKVPAGVCRDFARTKPIQVVYGPGTFINEAAGQVLDRINFDRSRQRAEANRAARAARRLAAARGLPASEQDRLADSARALVSAKYTQRALELAARYGLSSAPALNNPDFVLRLVFEPSLGAETPKPRFAYLFPGPNAALIQARLRPGLSAAQRREAIAMVREAVGAKAFELQFGSYVVSGIPVVTEGVARSISDELVVLLLVVAIVMALTLMLVFRTRFRLLPLGLALATSALTFGALSLVGASLTVASIAVLPVLVGLAVDYAIQFQSRFREEGSAEQAARRGGPVIATAGAATAAGFLVLLLSPVPMVRGFGALLVVGIVLAFAVTLTAGFGVLAGDLRLNELGRRFRTRAPSLPDRVSSLRKPFRGRVLSRRIPARFGRLTGRARGAPPARWAASFVNFVKVGTRGLIADAKLVPPLVKRWGRAVFGVAVRRPGRVLRIALLIAVVGWIAGTQVEVVSEITRLVPGDQREVRDLKTLQREAGTSGDVNVLVRSERLLDPDVVRWMTQYQAEILRRHGFSEKRPCPGAELCPALSLTNLFGSGRQTARQVEQVIDALPRYFSQNVITADRRTANIAFGIRTMPLEKQKELVDDMRAHLDPPRGVDAQLAGLPVLAADAHADLESSRWWLTLAGLLAVFGVLLAAYRRLEPALVPLIPVALATGWASLVLFVLQIPLNPMSATLGVLVIAISTEFAVLLSARYRSERAAGLEPVQALTRTYERTGAAVLASGVTAIAGFAALLVSGFPMLRDFGAVTVVNLSVSLLGVMVALPAALIWAEQRGPLRVPRSRAELAALARSAGRSSRAAARAAARAIRGAPAALRRTVGAVRRVVPSRK